MKTIKKSNKLFTAEELWQGSKGQKVCEHIISLCDESIQRRNCTSGAKPVGFSIKELLQDIKNKREKNL